MWLDLNNILFKRAFGLFGNREWMEMGHSGVRRV